ncbi:Nif11-like leader peptide family natural product precursor [Azospirillum sp. SYSU D00513]|uniref:Nif11-like leader peptide family natural product precursor n=1 Tax=Azospirillum sp. SYSU D00513 TaxID=2812561 RepID=UPI001A9757D0|nr:Nif11-like leader peptide family natural product precursor [Azospirillum sp. SYSU D00513]
MAGTNAELEKLKSLVESNPDALKGAAGSGDVKEASKALAHYASSKGISLTPEEIEKAFSENPGSGASVEALDDDALDKVSGGGSPWCIFTDGCYCFFTK